MISLTIITPTYNRGELLEVLYKSLCSQINFNFNWLIIDDGSKDDTKNIVRGFKTKKFDIKYVYKENGGKHTALNLAFGMLETELLLIVDSDDWLIPNATKQIVDDWGSYKYNVKLCGIVYARAFSDGRFICEEFKKDNFIDNYNSYIINQKINGDKAEVFRSDVIKNYRFPEYSDEKFVAEGVLWSKIARKYDMVFVNKPIYICNYLDGGLTMLGRKMRINNPCGGMYHAEEYLDPIYSFGVRTKNSILYIVYSLFAKKKITTTLRKSKNKTILVANLIPSYLIYLIWKYIYR